MRTFLGNISSIILGINWGILAPSAALYMLITLFDLVGTIDGDTLLYSIVLSDEPVFILIRIMLGGSSVFVTASLVANLALSHKLPLALCSSLPVIVAAFFSLFAFGPTADNWIASFLYSFGTQPMGLKALFTLALVNVIALYLSASWSGAQKGITAKTPLLFVQKNSIPHLQKQTFRPSPVQGWDRIFPGDYTQTRQSSAYSRQQSHIIRVPNHIKFLEEVEI